MDKTLKIIIKRIKLIKTKCHIIQIFLLSKEAAHIRSNSIIFTVSLTHVYNKYLNKKQNIILSDLQFKIPTL